MIKINKPQIIEGKEDFKDNSIEYKIRFSDKEIYTFIKKRERFSNFYKYTISFIENGINHKLYEVVKEEGGIPTAYLKPIAEVEGSIRKIKEMFYLVESHEHPDWVCIATLDKNETMIFKTNERKWFTTVYKSEKYTMVVEESHIKITGRGGKNISESTKVLYINKYIKNGNRRGDWKNAPVDLCIYTSDPSKDGRKWGNPISKINSTTLFNAEHVVFIEYKKGEISEEDFMKRYAPWDYIQPEIPFKPEWRRPLIRRSKFLEWFETLSPEAQAKLEAIWDQKEEERLEQERFGLNGLPIEVIDKKSY